MKKSTVLFILPVIFGALLLASCVEQEDSIPSSWPEVSLAESVGLPSYHITKVEGTYNGEPLTDFTSDGSYFNFEPISDTKLWFDWSAKCKQGRFSSETGEISVSGKPYDARFDQTISEADITKWVGDSGTGASDARLTMAGWIKANEVTIDGYPHLEYKGEIRIDCSWESLEDWENTQNNTLTLTFTLKSDALQLPTPAPLPESTLTGSIDFNGIYHPVTAAEASYNGKSLPGFNKHRSMLNIDKISATEVSLSCGLDFELSEIWEEYPEEGSDVFLEIPRITVSGEPYDVQFNRTLTTTKLSHYEGVEHVETDITVAVTGWMKAKGMAVEGDYVIPFYECEINLECTWDDEQKGEQTLNLKITGIDSYGFIEVD